MYADCNMHFLQRAKLVSELKSQRLTIRKQEKSIQELLKEIDVSLKIMCEKMILK
jgi:hypothetical protein